MLASPCLSAGSCVGVLIFQNVPPLFEVAVSVNFPFLCFFLKYEVRMPVGLTAGLRVVWLVRWSANCVRGGAKVGVDVGDGRCGSVVIGVGGRFIFRSRVGRCKCCCSRGTAWC